MLKIGFYFKCVSLRSGYLEFKRFYIIFILRGGFYIYLTNREGFNNVEVTVRFTATSEGRP